MRKKTTTIVKMMKCYMSNSERYGERLYMIESELKDYAVSTFLVLQKKKSLLSKKSRLFWARKALKGSV